MKSFQLSVFSYRFSLLRPPASGLQPLVFILHPSSFILFIIAFLVSLLAAPVFAESIQPPEIVGVRVGIGDRCKVGLWTPVEITILGGGEALTGTVAVTVPDGDGVPSRVLTPPNKPVQILPDRQTAVLLYVRFGRVISELKVDFTVDDRVVASKTMESSLGIDRDHFLEPLEAQPLIVAVGRTTMGIEDIPRLKEMDPEHRPVVARLNDVGQLPTRWYGYEGVDALLFSTSQAELYRKLTPDSDRLEALDQWIHMGGRLVLCVGSQADETLAEDSALARFAPGRLEKTVSLRQTGALEIYCGGSAAVPQTQGGDKFTLRSPKLVEIQGIVEAREADLPLVIRTPHGLGQIIFVAADLDLEPLSKWADRPLFLAKLLDLPAGRSGEPTGNAALTHYAYTDLSGQLRSALDRFSGVQVIPFSLVAMMIILYILLIGPGDYFFLRKIVRRMEWTWLTFPAIVLVISGATYILAYYLKGNQLRVNQADLVDVDAASGVVRGATWLNIFSPRMESFNLSLRPLPDGKEEVNAQSWLAWLGLQGSALGGMNPRGANPSPWPEHYSFAPDLSAMLGVPIQVWSTKSFTGRWRASGAAFPQAELSEEEQSLLGSITNTLGFPLNNCVLAHDRWAYEIGSLAPGETAILDLNVKRSELKTLLTGKKMIFGEKFSQEITPYDQSSTEAAYILRIMMFYNAIDGKSYTNMDNGYQTSVDLSDLLKTGRAILVAEGPNQSQEKFHGAALLCDGKSMTGPMDKHLTLYRFVFPVKTQSSIPETP